jgi:hypothetical protein
VLGTSNRRLVSLVATVMIIGAACGESAEPNEDTAEAPTGTTEASSATESPDDSSDDLEEYVEDLVESLEGVQEAEGGGTATLVVGGDSWTFDKVLCAFGPEEIGDPDAEFVLSSLQDGLQLYVSIDGFGHYVELADIGNFDDPSVHLVADSSMSMSGGPEEFVEVNGKEISATALFVDEVAENYDGVEGTLTATCP